VTRKAIGTLRLTSRGCFHDEQTTIEFERGPDDVEARFSVTRKGPSRASSVIRVRVLSTSEFRDFAERLHALIDAASVRGRFTSTTRIALSVDLDVEGVALRCSLDERADVDGMSVAYAGPAPIEALVQSLVAEAS
jgi:hypothetical protein